MKKKAIAGIELTLLILSMLTFALNVQQVKSLDPPGTEWTKTYGGSSYEGAYSVVQTLDGGYALAGYTDSFGAGWEDFLLVKVDSSGNPQWNKTYGGGSSDYACSVVVTGDGGYAIAGYTASFGEEGSDFWLVKTNAAGNMQWNKTYGGSGEDYAYSAVQTLDGGYALAGCTFRENYDFWLVKTDAAGNMQWNKTYGGNNIDEAHSVVQTLDGGYALAGYTASFGAGVEDFWLVRVDSFGNPQWNKTYGGSDHDYAYSVVQTGDGGYLLAGYTMSFGAGNEDFWLVKTDSSGNPQWNKTYGGSDYDEAHSVVQTLDGGYALAGYTRSFGDGSEDFWLVRVDSSGNPQWNKTYGGSNEDDAYSVVQTLDGGYALAGCTAFGEISSDFMLVKVGHPLAPSTRYPWPMFHHDLGHTGYTESPAPRTNQTLWTYPGGSISSSPAVADGKVYIGSYDRNLYCLNALNGSRIWYYTTGDTVTSSPAIADGKVYFGSCDRWVYALNALTGSFIWSYYIGWWVSSPAVVDGKVYIASYNPGKLYCLNALNGSHIWDFATGSDVTSSPAVVNGRVYIGSMNGKLYCLDTATGLPLWSHDLGSAIDTCSPAVVGDKVYVGSSDKLYCLNAFTGSHVWDYTAYGGILSSPAVADDKVYFGSNGNILYCLNAFTGSHIWHYTMGTPGSVSSSPAVADGKVYIGSGDYKLYCVDALTGSYIWSYRTDGSLESSPAIADGVLFVGGRANGVIALGNVIRVPEDYPTVAEAVGNATSGATISIAPGVYHESLVINKPLTLLGRKGSDPVFDGGGSGIAITIIGTYEVTITGIVITNYNQAIFIEDSSNCEIYNNIMTSNHIAINLTDSSISNTIYANTISHNAVGINVANSVATTIYHNNFVSNTQQIYISMPTGNIWDNGYPSGGNYWSDYTGVDEKSGPNQDQPRSDGIGDTQHKIDDNNIDEYPLMKPFSPHDLGIVSVIPLRTVVAQSFKLNIDVKIVNFGIYNEFFTVAVFLDTTVIATQTITLTKRNSTTLTLTWNIADFPRGDYTIKAQADILLDEIDPTDNTHIDGIVKISKLGDLNLDGVVNYKDASMFRQAYVGAYNYLADFNQDGTINYKDASLFRTYYITG